MEQVKKWLVSGWLAMMLSGTALAEGNFQKGVEAYNRGEFNAAIDAFTRSAEEEQNPRAQFNLGLLYDAGEIVEKNDEKALDWYKLAAENEIFPIPQAQFNLGLKYNNGEGVEKNVLKALELWLAAAGKDHIEAQYNLGVKYIEGGDGVDRNIKEAVKWTREAAMQGYAPAQFNLGLLYAEGDGIPRDYETAYAWFDFAATQEENLAVAIVAQKSLDKLAERMNKKQITEAEEVAEKCRAQNYEGC